MPYPDDLNPAAFADHLGDSPRAIAWESAIERQYDDLLFNLTDDAKRPNSQLTRGQDFINDLISEEELDGTIFEAIKAAALHLKNRKSMTAEQVGRILIESLEKDLTAIAERHAADAE